MKQLIIIGARGFGREIYCAATESVGYKEDFVIKGFLDSKTDALDGFDGYTPILSDVENYNIEENDIFVCALGDVKYRRFYTDIILSKGGKFATLIHKSAYISKNVEIGEGCMILSGARMQCDSSIGSHSCIQPYSIVGHDVVIGNYCQINTFVCCGGASKIGDSVTMHTSSFVLPKVFVGNDATIGAGSVAIKEVQPGTTVFGVPARVIPLPTAK